MIITTIITIIIIPIIKTKVKMRKRRRSILNFLLFAKTDGMNAYESDDVDNVKSLYYTEKKEHKWLDCIMSCNSESDDQYYL